MCGLKITKQSEKREDLQLIRVASETAHIETLPPRKPFENEHKRVQMCPAPRGAGVEPLRSLTNRKKSRSNSNALTAEMT